MNLCRCAAIMSVCIAVFCVAGCSNHKQSQSADIDNLDWTAAAAEANEHLQGVIANCTDDESDEYFETFNPWRVDYFHNEWGEATDDAFIYTVLSGTGWNLRVDYIPYSDETPDGLFRFSIVNSDGYIQDMNGPANILVRDADGETYAVDVIGVQGSMAFVEDGATVRGLIELFDRGRLDILIEFEKYLERHSCRARYDSTPGFFRRNMIEKLCKEAN